MCGFSNFRGVLKPRAGMVQEPVGLLGGTHGPKRSMHNVAKPLVYAAQGRLHVHVPTAYTTSLHDIATRHHYRTSPHDISRSSLSRNHTRWLHACTLRLPSQPLVQIDPLFPCTRRCICEKVALRADSDTAAECHTRERHHVIENTAAVPAAKRRHRTRHKHRGVRAGAEQRRGFGSPCIPLEV